MLLSRKTVSIPPPVRITAVNFLVIYPSVRSFTEKVSPTATDAAGESGVSVAESLLCHESRAYIYIFEPPYFAATSWLSVPDIVISPVPELYLHESQLPASIASEQGSDPGMTASSEMSPLSSPSVFRRSDCGAFSGRGKVYTVMFPPTGANVSGS